MVFRSSDASQWHTTFGVPGEARWGHDLTDFALPMGEVMLMRQATGENLTVTGIDHAHLYTCSEGDNGLWWDGSKYYHWVSYHLGICDNTTVYSGTYTGYVIVCGNCHNDRHSWGFGHRGWIDDQQGWGWDSKQLGATVFTVAVR